MIAFRSARPALLPQAWYSGLDDNGDGMAQLQWYVPAGALADSRYWNNPSNHSIAWQIE
jgi:glycogen operon protein